ncbi:Rho guanine nucleotide exchange factor scd1 [Psilocybe cubensis]|uniref:Rho guanine nucleotide exchange factor scd1 n=2 Tax=Psilocybe cubensis TaxID=181762 RepID=A0ACB8GGF6_PSICU|nr:Rho guanine nucleotide exchange factor scd1 [Psilocybe cubensis]KAH9474554.1 Rho guanine nucleotide exchange factor scd1 [Psilocybe cubensis]
MDAIANTLIQRLHKLNGFTDHFPNLSLFPPTDFTTHLWDILSTGTPLCYVFDQLPEDEDFVKINLSSLTKSPFEQNSDRAMKDAISIFALQVRAKPVLDKIPGCEIFSVEDFWERKSTENFLKVLNTVNAILDYLPQDAFKGDPTSPYPPLSGLDTIEYNNSVRNAIIQNILSTEQMYVQDLKLMQEYALALYNTNVFTQELSRILFPNLKDLLEFQRRFLMRLEFISKLPFHVQPWGQQFINEEDGFELYDKYCINYVNTLELVTAYKNVLSTLNHIINVQTELQSFLLKPIQRIRQYPALLEPLVKTFTPDTHMHYQELMRGLDVARRVADRTNGAQYRAEKPKVLNNLLKRVRNWKGHSPSSFGELRAYDLALVTKNGTSRPYAIFLFEKILLLCKEMGRKRYPAQRYAAPSDADASAMWQNDNPLELKGRIYLVHILSITSDSDTDVIATAHDFCYPLTIIWLENNLPESFTLQCRHEYQRSHWHGTFKSLMLRVNPETFEQPNSNSPRPTIPPERRHAINYHANFRRSALHKMFEHSESSTGYISTSRGEYSLSDSDGDDLEDYSEASYPPSGRQTPLSERRLHRSRSWQIITTTTKVDGNDINARRKLGRVKSTSSLPRPIPEAFSLSDVVAGENLRSPVEYNRSQASNQSHFSVHIPSLQINDATEGQDNPLDHPSSTTKIKIHFQSHIFLIRMSKTSEFSALQDELMAKVRILDPIRAQSGVQLRIKYQDEDGDIISLISTDDLQMALECGSQISLFVS